ncbi:MAG: N-6 DNA methylase [Candidatus Sedimenticola sp. (ex Thyasira tokunagai)]
MRSLDSLWRYAHAGHPVSPRDYRGLTASAFSLPWRSAAAVILPHGVLFRGNAEAEIRRNLIKQGYIKGIIGLPANLFYGTGIPACIIVIDKAGAKARLSDEKSGIFMIDAGKGFMKDGPKNRLRSQDIHKIVDVFNNRITQGGYSRTVRFSEIEANDYNLNIPRYIDSSNPEDLHDLSAHLKGGIPNGDIEALDDYWQVFPELRHSLFKHKRKGYSRALVAASEVKATILEHQEFKAFAKKSLARFNRWKKKVRLQDIDQGEHPKEIIHTLSEALLKSYTNAPLLDRYDMYQIIMDYWAEVMQDDVYFITQDGWPAANALRELVVKKGEKLKETPDLIINKAKYKAELIPPALIVQSFFATEQKALDALQATLDTATQKLEAYIEEHAVEGGMLEEALTDNGKVNKGSVTARLKQATDADEIAALKQVKKRIDAEANHKKQLKAAQEALDKKVFLQYPKLTEADNKALIVEDKWLATLQGNIVAEIERVTQQLANRVKTLEERYETPLPELAEEVATLSAKVDEHLRKMGLVW